MSREAVAVRALLRSCGTLQGVIILTERGMVAEGRQLTRSLVEDALCIAALHDQPDEFLAMLKEDFKGSLRLQLLFIKAQQMLDSDEARDRLQAKIDSLEKAQTMSPKKVAALGPFVKLYLAYQRLSDDSGHSPREH
jgi:hypothetical protein